MAVQKKPVKKSSKTAKPGLVKQKTKLPIIFVAIAVVAVAVVGAFVIKNMSNASVKPNNAKFNFCCNTNSIGIDKSSSYFNLDTGYFGNFRDKLISVNNPTPLWVCVYNIEGSSHFLIAAVKPKTNQTLSKSATKKADYIRYVKAGKNCP